MQLSTHSVYLVIERQDMRGWREAFPQKPQLMPPLWRDV